LVVNNDQHFYQWLVIRNSQAQRENTVVVEKPLFPRRELKVAKEMGGKGMSRINQKDMSDTAWDEQSIKVRTVLYIATVGLSLENHTELIFLLPM